MGFFLLEYNLVADYVERRAPLRAEHLGLAAEAHERGNLVLAGALTDPIDRAILVWSTDDLKVVEDWVRNDPYVINGLVTSWSIRPWTVVVGEGAAAV
jgi:uncharacterized protein